MNNSTNNNERYPLIEQEWSVHAQLTFTHTPAAEDGGAQGGGCPSHPPCYGFRRGNICFTTSPPPVPHNYGAEWNLHNPTSGGSNHGGNLHSLGNQGGNLHNLHSSPTPQACTNYGSLPSHRRTTQPYNRRCMSTCNIVLGRSDSPPCRHHHTVALTTTSLSDACDICSGGGRSPTSVRRAHTFTSHFCTRVPDKTPPPSTVCSRDAASQTSQASLRETLAVPGGGRGKSQGAKRLSRSPARLRGKSPLVNKEKSEPLQSSTDSCCFRKSQKKQQPQPPRTVHIDVYCTESDLDSSEGEGESSPQTVYENDKMRVVHKREKERLPQAIVRQKRRTLSETSMSSLYPSVRSSSVSMGPSISVCPSSQTNSNSGITSMTSSCALFSDDSLAATSWKDTTTEMESLRQSDISLTKTESFEYEDFADRLRIREKEKKWAEVEEEGKTWRSPETERKHLLQQQKCQQYVQRRGSPFPRWKPDDSSEESDHSSYSEMAWSFGRLDELNKRVSPTVKREDTVKRSGVDSKVLLKRSDSGSLSDSGAISCSSTRTKDTIGPFGRKPDSPPKLKLDSVVVTPFAPAVTGAESDFLSKARKFGTIVDGFRKPGHHVGPSKNPDCLCENCQRHYKERWMVRGRARSLGNEAANQRERLKETLQRVVQGRQPETMEENDSSCV